MTGGLSKLPAAQFFTLYGEVLYLLFHAPLQRLYSVADIEKRIIQPMVRDQFRIYRTERGPVALITWAVLNDDLHAQMRDGQIDLARGETTQDTAFGGIDNVRDEFTPLGSAAGTVPAGDLPFFPPVRLLAGMNLDYRPLNSRLRLEVQHVDDQDRVGQVPDGSEVDIAGTIPTDSYTFLNAYLSVQVSPNISLSLRARNLTDEFARSATSFLAQSAPLPGRDIRFGSNWRF